MRLVKGMLIGLLSLLSLQSPLHADTRSATIHVSCTILPILEISSAKAIGADSPSSTSKLPEAPSASLEMNSNGLWVDVRTNLGEDYQITEAYQKTPAGNSKLYSATAL